MIELKFKKDCCGCTACYSVCPKHAIRMVEDNEGFLYPEINLKVCVNCHLCEKVCPYCNNSRPNIDLERVYAAKTNDEIIRRKSSSGGMFAEFAKVILERNGIVIGAAYDSNWLVYHKAINKLCDLDELIGSKYMQSNLGEIFRYVELCLKEDKLLLFVGTTCQINGLKNYLRAEYSNLYTIDFICLGVPSPKVWMDYLSTFFYDVNIQKINFKEKSLGWHSFSLKIEGDDYSFCRDGRQTYYYTGYFRHLYTRPSCSNCTYKSGNRMSDITISDCWGAEKIAPEMDDNKGLSSVICHSEKGLNLFKECAERMSWKEAKLEDVLKYNGGYRTCVEESQLKEKFWNDYYLMNKVRLFRKYCSPDKNDIWHKVMRKIQRIVKRRIRRKL